MTKSKNRNAAPAPTVRCRAVQTKCAGGESGLSGPTSYGRMQELGEVVNDASIGLSSFRRRRSTMPFPLIDRDASRLLVDASI